MGLPDTFMERCRFHLGLCQAPKARQLMYQDKLLASSILSTISGELLSSFTGTTTAYKIWSKACKLFAATSGAKVSQLKQELHSLKKGNLSIADDLAQIKKLCDLLATSRHLVSDDEKV